MGHYELLGISIDAVVLFFVSGIVTYFFLILKDLQERQVLYMTKEEVHEYVNDKMEYEISKINFEIILLKKDMKAAIDVLNDNIGTVLTKLNEFIPTGGSRT
jgi:hypothetical protein